MRIEQEIFGNFPTQTHHIWSYAARNWVISSRFGMICFMISSINTNFKFIQIRELTSFFLDAEKNPNRTLPPEYQRGIKLKKSKKYKYFHWLHKQSLTPRNPLEHQITPPKKEQKHQNEKRVFFLSQLGNPRNKTLPREPYIKDDLPEAPTWLKSMYIPDWTNEEYSAWFIFWATGEAAEL